MFDPRSLAPIAARKRGNGARWLCAMLSRMFAGCDRRFAAAPSPRLLPSDTSAARHRRAPSSKSAPRPWRCSLRLRLRYRAQLSDARENTEAVVELKAMGVANNACDVLGPSPLRMTEGPYRRLSSIAGKPGPGFELYSLCNSRFDWDWSRWLEPSSNRFRGRVYRRFEAVTTGGARSGTREVRGYG